MTLAPMMTLSDLLDKVQETDDVDFLRETVSWLVQALMDEEVSARIGADRYERSDDRMTQRNGYRKRDLNTRVGTIEVGIPKLRQGSYFPEWLVERGRPTEKALIGVVMAWEGQCSWSNTRDGWLVVYISARRRWTPSCQKLRLTPLRRPQQGRCNVITQDHTLHHLSRRDQIHYSGR